MIKYKGYKIPETQKEIMDVSNKYGSQNGWLLSFLCYGDDKLKDTYLTTKVPFEEFVVKTTSEEKRAKMIAMYISQVKVFIDAFENKKKGE